MCGEEQELSPEQGDGEPAEETVCYFERVVVASAYGRVGEENDCEKQEKKGP
jgi:hypothetical protein